MVLQSCLQKSILLLCMASVLFVFVAASAPVAGDTTSGFFINGVCKYYTFNCTNPLIRKEWKTMNNTEKKNYLDAVNCLAQKPTLSVIHAKFPGTVNRYDDFVAVHSNQTPNIHWVGFFIIWHRYFSATLEKALRNECNYTGAQPYWNSASDIASGQKMNRWSIFSNTTGFGGNGPYVPLQPGQNPFNISGTTGGGCVPAGPFGTGSTFQVNMGPGANTSNTNSQCLKRDFCPPIMAWGVQSNVDLVMKQPNFTAFAKQLENVPSFTQQNIHGAGHFGIGGVLGQMGDVYNSPADPLFFMHHTNLDRIYWQWQIQDPIKRLCEVGGPTIPFDYSLTLGPPVTLNFTINIDVMGPTIAVGDLLSTVGGPLCYVYDRIW